MTYSELTRKLRRLGCYPTRFGAGSHELWRNPATHTQTPIPYHSAKDIGAGPLARILRQLGIERDTFDEAQGLADAAIVQQPAVTLPGGRVVREAITTKVVVRRQEAAGSAGPR